MFSTHTRMRVLARGGWPHMTQGTSGSCPFGGSETATISLQDPQSHHGVTSHVEIRSTEDVLLLTLMFIRRPLLQFIPEQVCSQTYEQSRTKHLLAAFIGFFWWVVLLTFEAVAGQIEMVHGGHQFPALGPSVAHDCERQTCKAVLVTLTPVTPIKGLGGCAGLADQTTD